MKRFTALLVLILMIVLGTGVLTALAGSASADISGPDSAEVGGTYTYTYTLSVSAACAANLNVSVGGAFEKVSGGDGLFHDSIPSNTNATYSGTVTVRVKADAAPGDKGTISASGGYSYLDEAYNESSGAVSKSLSVTVTAASTPAPSAMATPAAAKTPKPSGTPAPSATATPTPSATPTSLPGWAMALDDANAMAEGGAVTVTQPESTLVPAELLSVLRAKGGRLIADFGTYICIIDGQTLGGAADVPLDLAMSMDKDDALSAAAGGADVFQLHFAHEGELPGPVTVSFAAEGYSPGDTLYLYYCYASSGATEFRQSAAVGEDGRVAFIIYHCSAYYVADSAPEAAAGAAASAEVPTAAPPAATKDGLAAAVAPGADAVAGGYSLTALLLTAGVALIVGGGTVFLVLRLPAAKKKTRPGGDDMGL